MGTAFAVRPAFASHARKGNVEYQATEREPKSFVDACQRRHLLAAKSRLEQLRNAGLQFCREARAPAQTRFRRCGTGSR